MNRAKEAHQATIASVVVPAIHHDDGPRCNLERAESGLVALRAWRAASQLPMGDGHWSDEADLADLLCDLMHLARLSITRTARLRDFLQEYRGERWDFDVELRRARTHHDTERGAPSWHAAYSGP